MTKEILGYRNDAKKIFHENITQSQLSQGAAHIFYCDVSNYVF